MGARRDKLTTTNEGGRSVKNRTQENSTYKTTNLRGRVANIGNRVKQMAKQARAAKLQAPKTNSRSHLLTASHVSLVAHEAQCLHHMQNLKHA